MWRKWIERKPVVVLSSEATAAFLYELIVRFGIPAVVRCDMGTEFLGDFDQLCCYLGIARRPILMLNPRANGLVERYNRKKKSGLRQCCDMCGKEWLKVLPDVLMAMQMLPMHPTGRSAYELAYK